MRSLGAGMEMEHMERFEKTPPPPDRPPPQSSAFRRFSGSTSLN
ncbi:hypothetical protein QYR00_05055 [Agrobacterium tumefaciens]|nr:hypothetical protein QYR00_05055 [Agrobacterium tumefaciens]